MSVVASEALPWPVSGCARAHVEVSSGATVAVTEGGTNVLSVDGPWSAWVLLPAGSITVTVGALSSSATVGEGETWAVLAGLAPPLLVRQSASPWFAAWAEGFGFGLVVFGFGWILRLTKKIPADY